MKRILVIFFALALSVSALATNKVVTSVSSTASTVLTPGTPTIITIQNNGSGDVFLGLDGGITNRQKSTPDPTSSSGYLLVAGASITISCPSGTVLQQIRAILKTATTTTLLITTNDPYST